MQQMLQEYIVLYTNTEGILHYIETGACQARIKKTDEYEFQIIVPRQVVRSEIATQNSYAEDDKIILDVQSVNG